MMKVIPVPHAQLPSWMMPGAVIVASTLVLSIVVGRFGPIPVLVAMAILAALWILGALLRVHQVALVATISIGTGVLVDWYELLPWPLGVRLPLTAGAIALAVVSFRFLTRSPRNPWVLPPLLGLWIMLMILAAPAIAAGALFSESLDYYLWFMIIPLLMYLMGMFIAEDLVQLRRLFSLLSGLGTLVAVHTLIYVWTGIFLLETAYARSYRVSRYNFILSSTDTSRAGSFLLNPDSNGTFLGVMLILPLALCLQSRSWKARILYGVETLAISLALLATYSIGAIVSVAIGLIVFLALVQSARLRVGLFAVIGGIVVLFWAAFPAEINALVQHGASGELVDRAAIWQSTIHMIEANPIAGIGLGQRSYLAQAGLYRISQLGGPVPTPHNSYLELAAFAGLPVLAVFLALLVGLVWRAVRNVRKAEGWQRTLLAAAIGAAIALSVNSTEGIGWTLGPVAWLVWILLGAASSPFLSRMLSFSGSVPRTYRRRAFHDASSALSQPVPAVTPSDPSLMSRVRDARFSSVVSKPVLAPWSRASTRLRSFLATPRWRTDTQHMIASVRALKSSSRSSESPVAVLVGLVKSSGVYALASVSGPLVSIILAPYLAHQLTPSDYGTLTLVNTVITLIALVTQLGMSAAFLRAYNYDYSSQRDHHAVMASSLVLLCIVSFAAVVGMAAAAPSLAKVFLHRASLASLIILAAAVLLAQNLTVPGFAWLRAENRSLAFSLLSIASFVMTLAANFVLVGVLQMGIAGAVIATGAGYAVAATYLVPAMVSSAGIRIRWDVAWNLLTFGVPHVPGFVSYWVLQLSDRYLLSLFASLAQVASYAVSYSLGWIMTTVLIGPFALAWPPIMYIIARREDAANVYRLVFRAFGFVLLFAALALSFAGTFLLDALFPASYQTAGPIIPLVASSSVLYGLYYVLMVGADLRRKAWLVALFMGVCALVNVALNLILIPRYGGMGAALSTLVAYATLAVLAYVGNQLIYPIPFEVGRFLIASAVGICVYLGSHTLAHKLGSWWTWPVDVLALVIYGVTLLSLSVGGWPLRSSADVVPARSEE